MTDSGVTQVSQSPIEGVLADELARGDVVLGTIGPMLGMLLANHDNGLFSDEVVARVRAMARSVASEMLVAQAEAGGIDDPHAFAQARGEALAEALARDLGFLGHCHALTLEYRLAAQLERRNGIDPVVSPLMQALIASPGAETAQLAMMLLAAQARFVQRQRRMELPLAELPAALHAHALATWHAQAEGTSDNAIGQADQRLRDAYDERATRIALLTRAVGAVGDGMKPALTLGHAGVAMFLTALSLTAGLERDLAAAATNDSQFARLATALRAAGLKPEQIAEQFALLHPDMPLPHGFDTLRTDRAAAILAASARQTLD